MLESLFSACPVEIHHPPTFLATHGEKEIKNSVGLDALEDPVFAPKIPICLNSNPCKNCMKIFSKCIYIINLNAIFSKPLKKLLSSETEVDDAALISIDSKGTDIRVRQGAQVCIFDNS